MSEPKPFYDEIVLSDGFIAALGDGATPDRLAQIRADTMALVKLLCGKPYLPKEVQQTWIERIKNQEIDPDAAIQRQILTRDDTYQVFFKPYPILKRLIEKGKSGEAVFEALLDTSNDPFGDPREGVTPLYALMERERETGTSPYAKVIVTHPKIDVNRGTMLVRGEECNDMLSMCICEWSLMLGRIPDDEDKLSVERMAWFISLLLKQGALMSWHYEQSHREQGMYDYIFESELFKPYYTQCHDEWRQWQEGALNPENITMLQLGRFDSIGKLEEAMNPERWKGHEAQALMLYDELPEYVKRHAPCLDARNQMLIYVLPKPQVQGWSLEIEPRTAPAQHKS